jgi:hypothetical protein
MHVRCISVATAAADAGGGAGAAPPAVANNETATPAANQRADCRIRMRANGAAMFMPPGSSVTRAAASGGAGPGS